MPPVRSHEPATSTHAEAPAAAGTPKTKKRSPVAEAALNRAKQRRDRRRNKPDAEAPADANESTITGEQSSASVVSNEVSATETEEEEVEKQPAAKLTLSQRLRAALGSVAVAAREVAEHRASVLEQKTSFAFDLFDVESRGKLSFQEFGHAIRALAWVAKLSDVSDADLHSWFGSSTSVSRADFSFIVHHHLPGHMRAPSGDATTPTAADASANTRTFSFGRMLSFQSFTSKASSRGSLPKQPAAGAGSGSRIEGGASATPSGVGGHKGSYAARLRVSVELAKRRYANEQRLRRERQEARHGKTSISRETTKETAREKRKKARAEAAEAEAEAEADRAEADAPAAEGDDGAAAAPAPAPEDPRVGAFPKAARRGRWQRVLGLLCCRKPSDNVDVVSRSVVGGKLKTTANEDEAEVT
jgi:hypothetical protein